MSSSPVVDETLPLTARKQSGTSSAPFRCCKSSGNGREEPLQISSYRIRRSTCVVLQGEKLVQTTSLPQMTLDVARRIWGGSDAELLGLSLRLDETRATLIAPYLTVPVQLNVFEYVVEYADPSQDVQTDRRRRRK